MPYDVLEAQIKSLPEAYYNELVDYLEFLLQKADKEKNSLKKMRETSLQTVWEEIKNDFRVEKTSCKVGKQNCSHRI